MASIKGHFKVKCRVQTPIKFNKNASSFNSFSNKFLFAHFTQLSFDYWFNIESFEAPCGRHRPLLHTLHRNLLLFLSNICFPVNKEKRINSLNISLSPVAIWFVERLTTDSRKPLGTAPLQRIIVFTKTYTTKLKDLWSETDWEGWVWFWPVHTCGVYHRRVTQHGIHQDGTNKKAICQFGSGFFYIYIYVCVLFCFFYPCQKPAWGSTVSRYEPQQLDVINSTASPVKHITLYLFQSHKRLTC